MSSLSRGRFFGKLYLGPCKGDWRRTMRGISHSSCARIRVGRGPDGFRAVSPRHNILFSAAVFLIAAITFLAATVPAQFSPFRSSTISPGDPSRGKYPPVRTAASRFLISSGFSIIVIFILIHEFVSSGSAHGHSRANNFMRTNFFTHRIVYRWEKQSQVDIASNVRRRRMFIFLVSSSPRNRGIKIQGYKPDEEVGDLFVQFRSLNRNTAL